MRAWPLGLLLLSFAVEAEEAPPPPSLPPIKVTLLDESISLPSLDRLFTGFNPGAELGSELIWLRRPGHLLFQALDLGFIHHPGFASWAFLTTALGYRPTLVAGLFLEVSLGLGYLASFLDAPRYSAQDGTFRAAPGPLHHLAIVASLGLGYRLGAFEPFLGYGLLVELPFIPATTIVVAHQLLQVGLRIALPLGGGTP